TGKTPVPLSAYLRVDGSGAYALPLSRVAQRRFPLEARPSSQRTSTERRIGGRTMVTRLAVGFAVAASAVLALTAARAADEKEKKVEVVRPVSGKAINKDHSLAYKEAKVYFCCPNCPKAFEKDPAKFATNANLQLVQTEQAVEKKCPLTGRPLNKAQTVKIKGLDVQFCCANCK